VTSRISSAARHTKHHNGRFARAVSATRIFPLGLAALATVAFATYPASGQSAAAPQKSAVARTPATERAVLDQYCVTCHNDRSRTANFSLQKLDLSKVGDEPEVWEKVVRKLRAGVMPPPGVRRPPLPEYEGLRDFLETEIDRKAAAHANPGEVLLHRLNRAEYANAIRDLLDLQIDPASLLPPDDSARGFDNIAGSLTISPTLLESYLTAATRIARMAVGFWKTPAEAVYIAPADTSQTQRLEGLPFGTRGGMQVRHTFPADGDYKFSIQNFGLGRYVPGEKIELLIDNQRAKLTDYAGVGMNQGVNQADGQLDISIPVKAGSHEVAITFLATNYRPSLDMIRQYDRKSLEQNTFPQLEYYPAIGWLQIQGPFHAVRPEDSPTLKKVITCHPTAPSQEEACAKQILTTLVRRAFRRPASQQDMEWVWGFYLQGRREGAFNDGIELALRRILASPQFLVRFEDAPPKTATATTYRISDLELASRLSFFLWSSIPDDELITLASQNKLHTSPVLEQQVRRMLADSRSSALIENFADQLLYLRNLPATAPDGVYYPDWDDELRQSMRRETEMLFNSILREDRSVVELLTANYTFLNERLARQYGIPGIYGSHFRRYTFPPEMDYRRGLLGQGSFLSVTWVQNFRTSPVKRGVWVLENILGTPPPEPPPNVPPLEDTKNGSNHIMTLREQMTLHRKQEPCASCHKMMDPIGFSLENFDADGKWRTKQGGDGGVPIDASAELWDGTKVNGPVDLRNALRRYSPQFVRMITEKMLTYALGRGVEYYDMPVIRSIVKTADQDNDKFSAILMGVIKSSPFQMRASGLSTTGLSTTAAASLN
jgi:hypothetical protein